MQFFELACPGRDDSLHVVQELQANMGLHSVDTGRV